MGDIAWFKKNGTGRTALVTRVDAHGNLTVMLYRYGRNQHPHTKTLKKGAWGLLSEVMNRVYYKKTQYVFVSSCKDGKTATIGLGLETTTVPMNELEVILPDKNNTNATTPNDTADPNMVPLLGANDLDYTLIDFVQYEAEACNEYINSSDTETDDFDYYDTLESGLANDNAPDSDSDDEMLGPTDGTVTPDTTGTAVATLTPTTVIPKRSANDNDMKSVNFIMHDRYALVGCTEYKAAEYLTLTAQQAKNYFKKWILDTARQSPMFLLPIDPGCFQKLQATKNPQVAKKVFDWMGFVSGGFGTPLPAPYVSNVFSRDLIRECKSKPGVPIDCTRVGSAKSPMEEDRASASATVVVGSHKVQYPQGVHNHCVANSTASALHFAGDEKAGKTIASLAPAAIKERKSVVYVQSQCRENLRPMWETVKLKNAAMVDWHSLLGLDSSVVTVVQIKDSTGNLEHCVSIVSGWIFDTNKEHAIKLSKEGLDACCMGGATFAAFQAGFQLIHTKKRGREEM